MVEHSAQLQQDLRAHILAQPADRFGGKPWDLIREIEEFATTKKMRMIYLPNKINVSKNALAAMNPKPKVVVEFGTFVGTSAIAWAAILQEFHGTNADDIKVFTFEYSPKVAAVARDLIKAAGLDNVIEVMVGSGADSLRKLHSEGRVKPGQVDVVFIDHWEQYYLPDLKLVEQLQLFHVGSLVLADNTDIPGAPDYVAYVKKGGDGPVKYESQSFTTDAMPGQPNIVECSKVVAV